MNRKQSLAATLETVVENAVSRAGIQDIHTHLVPPAFGDLLLWGIDELLTYHYLVAELFRVPSLPVTPEQFWTLKKSDQADLVWKHLFLHRSPVSEAARGVLTCLRYLGLDPDERDLADHRRFFADTTVEAHLDRVLEVSGVHTLVMTNDPFEEQERALWMQGGREDSRFRAALRIDPLLTFQEEAGSCLNHMGYAVDPDLSPRAVEEVNRFLRDWIRRMRPVYLAASVTPAFRFPDPSITGRILEECVLPVAKEAGLPFALMVGVRRRVNPALALAGDGVGRSDLSAISNLCAGHPDSRFLCTALARENQHELAVLARKFGNLHIFGCWWFLNVPSLAEEITRLRIELLGHGFTAQHSDARVLDQLLYKWHDARGMLSRVVTDRYAALCETGWQVSEEQIRREVAGLLGGSGMQFVEGGC